MSRTYKNVIAKWVWDPASKSMVEVPVTYKPKVVDAPGVIQDTMDPLEHPANGRVYDSKSAFRYVTKLHGLEERGNEARVAPNKPQYKGMSPEDYKDCAERSYYEVKYQNAPLSEYERERCKRINERIRLKP